MHRKVLASTGGDSVVCHVPPEGKAYMAFLMAGQRQLCKHFGSLLPYPKGMAFQAHGTRRSLRVAWKRVISMRLPLGRARSAAGKLNKWISCKQAYCWYCLKME